MPTLDELGHEPGSEGARRACHENSHPLLLLTGLVPGDEGTGSSVTVSRRRCYPVYEVMEIEQELRPYLFAIATGCSGRSDAEDVVQEAFLRYHASDADVESPKAYLATVTTRLAIDELRSARSRREVYPGEWLLEPLVEDEAVRHAETADSLSMTFLHLLEKLSPVERAVFLLREVFDYDYEEVSRIVGKTPANARQILARAHAHIQDGRRRFEVSREERDEVARRFLAAWEEGDTAALVEWLAPMRPSTGRRQRAGGPGAARRRRAGREGAHRLGTEGAGARLHLPVDARQRRAGRRLYDPGDARWVAAFEIADGVVVAVRSVLNPDKLTHVPPSSVTPGGRALEEAHGDPGSSTRPAWS